MKKLSIIGRDYHTDENVVGYYNTADRMKYWGKLGALLGRVLGPPVWLRVLFYSRCRPVAVCRTDCRLDRRRPGRRRGGGWIERPRRRTLRHGNSQEQHSAIRDGGEERQVCLDRPRLRRGNGSRARNHQSHQPGSVGSPSTRQRGKICGVSMICEHPERGWSLRPSRVPKPESPVHFNHRPQTSIPDMKINQPCSPAGLAAGWVPTGCPDSPRNGHGCAVFDRLPKAVTGLAGI